MALRKIALQGEPCLTKVCRPVTDFNGRLHTLLDDLADTLADSGGVGLAAPQVGVLRRVCVVLDEEEQLIELVNPEIIRTEGEQTGLEGCLSVPGKYGEVTRPEIVRVRAQDRNGDWFEVEDEGLTARCFCHEIEHLDGHLFVEHTDHLLTEEELEAYIRQCEAENGDEDDQLIELINPEIIRTEGEQTGLEGCLSVPGKYGVVTRPEIVRVRAQDRDGNWFEVEDEGLTARCFCHEIEHLDGHLFVEHTDHLMEGDELQQWLEEHADEYEIEEDEDKE